MAQPLGRDPSRPFAALAAAQGLGLSGPGRRARRSRQSDAARHSSTEGQTRDSPQSGLFEARIPTTREGADLRAGALLVREWKGKLERVTVLEMGFAWNGKSYASLSQIATAMTGTSWNGHRFFGLRTAKADRAAQAARRGRVDDPNTRPDAASVELMATMQVVQRPRLPGKTNTSAAGSAVTYERGCRRDAAAAAS